MLRSDISPSLLRGSVYDGRRFYDNSNFTLTQCTVVGVRGSDPVRRNGESLSVALLAVGGSRTCETPPGHGW